MASFLKFLASFCFAFIVAAIAYWRIPSGNPSGPPLLNGGTQFTILSVITAIAVYLRHVNLSAIESRYKVRHRESWNRLPELKYRERRIKRLEHTSFAISMISPYLFVIILAIAWRIVYDAYSRFWFITKAQALQQAPRQIYIYDAVISSLLLVAFAGLTIAHLIVRFSDDRLLTDVLSDPTESVRAQELRDEVNITTRPEEKKATA